MSHIFSQLSHCRKTQTHLESCKACILSTEFPTPSPIVWKDCSFNRGPGDQGQKQEKRRLCDSNILTLHVSACFPPAPVRCLGKRTSLSLSKKRQREYVGMYVCVYIYPKEKRSMLSLQTAHSSPQWPVRTPGVRTFPL